MLLLICTIVPLKLMKRQPSPRKLNPIIWVTGSPLCLVPLAFGVSLLSGQVWLVSTHGNLGSQVRVPQRGTLILELSPVLYLHWVHPVSLILGNSMVI